MTAIAVRLGLVVGVLALLTMAILALAGAPADAITPQRFTLALAIQFAAAAAAFPTLSRPSGVRAAAVAVAALPILLAPLLIPPSATLARFLAAIAGGTLVMKMYDLHVAAGRGRPIDLTGYLGFLPNLSLVQRKVRLEPRPGRRENGVRLVASLVVVAALGATLLALRRLDWSVQPFAFEHGVKAVVVFGGIVAVISTLVHTVRLAGGTTRDFADAPWRARTPAEFWQRYNRCVGQFFYEDVFRSLRRGRPAAVAVVMTFAVSGMLHEYVFGMATGRVQGYQLAFFLLQGAGVAATARLKPRGRAVIPARVGTLAFVVATSVLFFASFHGVAPIYARGVPGWLW